MKRKITIQPTTKKQREILLLLLKFRFLNTHQIQILLGHKNKSRILKLLKDLIEKDCIRRKYDIHSLEQKSKYAVYYLGPKSRHIFVKEKDVPLSELEYIYSESRRDKKFIDSCQFLADIYLFLLSQNKNSADVKFFTKFELSSYTHFPDPLPDAFVAIGNNGITRRYFIDFFDDYTPSFVIRKRFNYYLTYKENSNWDENTNSLPLPKILFITGKHSLKTHITEYGGAKLENTYDEDVSFYVTTKDKVKFGKDNIWGKIE